MHGLALEAIRAAEKQTLKLCQSHWSIKCRSRTPSHSILRTITVRGLTLTAVIAAVKYL